MKKDHIKRRTMMAFTGTVMAGVSVGGLQKANFGIDPFTSFVTGIAKAGHLSFNTGYVAVVAVLLVIAVLTNRRTIGTATLLNLLICGSVATFVKNILDAGISSDSVIVRGAILIVSLGVMSVGSSLYFTADLGVSAYDAIAITLSERYSRPAFRVWRILSDVICCVTGYIFGVTLGIGTIITALFLGPAIQWLNVNTSRILLYGKNK